MGYLIFIHWYRWYILTKYSIDVTGPMMVLTQKVTTMAFSLHDGKIKKAEELTEIQKREKLR
jgi:lysophospholipid acyltransferase 1/2